MTALPRPHSRSRPINAEHRRAPVRWFARCVIAWQRRHGRNDLPWQRSRDPYRIWVSEIMLQQTRVAAVIPYYERFIERFPNIEALGRAAPDEVLHYWTGLGYYARARNMHKAAVALVANAGAERAALPVDLEALCALPGIGPSTAAAILALSRGASHPILDGNVRRVLSRFYAVPGESGSAALQRTLWALAARNTPARGVARYTQGIMDLGAMVCLRRTPLCGECPVAGRCRARRRGLQQLLPTPRKRRPLPLRAVCMVFVYDEQQRVLLEQRPAPGVWGGLWAPPECAPGDDIGKMLRQRCGIETTTPAPAPLLRHTFTHFILEITPLHARLVRHTTEIKEARPQIWYAPQSPQAIGLPAPVYKLLNPGTATDTSGNFSQQGL